MLPRLSEQRERALKRKIDQLMRRILQLDDLMCRDALLDEARAKDLRDQIRKRQCQLEALYQEFDLTREGA